MDKKSKYSGSFTSGALFYSEFVAIEPVFSETNIKAALGNEVKQNKYLAIKTENARKKIVGEMKKRIDNAPPDFWAFFYRCAISEQKLSLFYLCLKTYYLIFDFHFEVTLPKWKIHSISLDRLDIQMRFDKISSIDEVVNNWSEQTKDKLNQQYRKILTEAGLMSENELIKPNDIGTFFWDYFINLNESWFIEACFYSKNI